MSALWLLREDASRPEQRRAPSGQPEDDTGHRGWLCCRACGARVASPASELHRGEAPLIFANPHGLIFEIIALRDAHGLIAIGESTLEATWFSGYGWRVALCGACLSHLGWHYSALVPGLSPSSFYGLIRRQLVETSESSPER